MNYIWYPLIIAIEYEYDISKIHFQVKDKEFYCDTTDKEFVYNAEDHRISPLFEYLPTILYDPSSVVNLDDKFSYIDINPYYRFGDIFKHILHPDRDDTNDLVICDIVLHILAYVDRICGMSKHDYKVMIIINEIEQGCYGETNDVFRLFNLKEKKVLAESLIMLYETENCFRSLDTLFNRIMTDFKIGLRDNQEIVIHHPYEFDEQKNKKLLFILKMFLPIGFPYVIHWHYTYGIVGHETSMVMEEFFL